MRHSLPLTGGLLFMLLVCAVAGCGHSERPDPAHPSRGWASRVDAEDPATQRALVQALKSPREFSLCLSEGSGLYGYDSVVIEGESCRMIIAHIAVYGGHTYSARTQYDFRTTPAERAKLLVHLRSVAALPRLYSSGIVDGTQVIVAMIVDGHRKEVYCDNYFPKQIVKLRNYLFEELVPNHHNELKVTNAAHNLQHNQLW